MITIKYLTIFKKLHILYQNNTNLEERMIFASSIMHKTL